MTRTVRLWIVILAGLPVLGLGLLIGVGSMLSSDHVAASRADYPVSPDSLWAVVTDFPHIPQWRAAVLRMERLPDRNGHPVWMEVGAAGNLPMEITEWDPPRRFVTRIADPELPFGGSWTYRIEKTAEGCVLEITEEGTIRNPVYRCLARFVFGYHSTMDEYLRSLGGRWSLRIEARHVGSGG